MRQAVNAGPATGCQVLESTPLLALGLALGAILLSGCAGYTLGPTNGVSAQDRSVQVNPFVNKTLEAHLTDNVTEELRKALQHDATFHVTTHDDGNIVVSGTLVRYQRVPISFEENDTLTGLDYRLILTAEVTAKERSTGKVVLEQSVNGYTLIRTGNDLTTAERQAMPLLAADLAKHVTALLVDGSW